MSHPRPPSPPAGRHSERGLSESVQWALLTATAVALLIGGVQTAIVMHARTVVANAALAGAEAEAVLGGTGAAANDAARTVAARSGLTKVTVTGSVTPDTVTVSVTTEVPVLLGVGPRHVTRTATIPREP